MTQVLILTDPDHRDYAADFLAHGFVALCGAGNVVEYPRKPSLHWTAEPVFDCDFDLSTTAMGQEEVETALRDRGFDLVVVPTLRGTVPQRLYFWRALLRLHADRLAYYDGEDHAMDTRPLFVQTTNCAPVAYFKREMPLDETWAVPLPFGYPAERVVSPDNTRHGAIYSAFIWEWARGGLRERLATELRKLPGADVVAADDDKRRIAVAANHSRNRRALVAVSPAGQGYHTNRHLEVIADGCCPILERPWRQWPHAPQPALECSWFCDALDAVDAVRDALDEPEETREMARAAQRLLLARHTTRARARTVWEAVHGSGTGAS